MKISIGFLEKINFCFFVLFSGCSLQLNVLDSGNPVEIYSVHGLNGLKAAKGLDLDYIEGPDTNRGVTVLMLAVVNEDVKAVDHILSSNVDINVYNQHGQTALDLALTHGFIEIQYLLENEIEKRKRDSDE